MLQSTRPSLHSFVDDDDVSLTKGKHHDDTIFALDASCAKVCVASRGRHRVSAEGFARRLAIGLSRSPDLRQRKGKGVAFNRHDAFRRYIPAARSLWARRFIAGICRGTARGPMLFGGPRDNLGIGPRQEYSIRISAGHSKRTLVFGVRGETA